MSLPIDLLGVEKSHLNLSDQSLPSDFGFDDYILSKVFDDIILVEYIDLVSGEGGDTVNRNGLLIPISVIQNAWRKGKVILVGPRVNYTKVGDIVVFPSNLGIPVTNLEVENHGPIKKGIFLNENRMFGICKLKNEENIES